MVLYRHSVIVIITETIQTYEHSDHLVQIDPIALCDRPYINREKCTIKTFFFNNLADIFLIINHSLIFFPGRL